MFFLLVGIVVYGLDAAGVSIRVFGIGLKWYVQALPFVVSLILFSFAVAALLVKNYPCRHELNFSSVKMRFHITNSKGSYTSSIYYTITNRNRGPVAEIRGEREGFSREVPSIDVCYSLFGASLRSKATEIKYQLPPTPFYRNISARGTITKVHTWEWSIELVPPPGPGETIHILRTVDGHETEIDAFSEKGTYVGWRVIYPTLYVEFNLIAPPRYQIIVLDYYCVSEQGEVEKREKELLSQPSVSGCGSHLIWSIFFPLREHRYRIQYRLEEEKKHEHSETREI